jgi:multiple sugar transport system permease protein
MSEQIFHDSETDLAHRARWFTSKLVIYGILIVWTIVCLFPIYWTITTSFKMAPDVMRGNMIPWVDYRPAWLGWRSLGLSPETIGAESTVREQFMQRFFNSVITSLSASTLAVALGSLAAYGLSRFSFKFGFMRNQDISFFFLSQLILPPVVLALPFLVLYRELDLLDTRIGLILLYTLTVLPIVIWIMRDQFAGIPTELEEAALVDGLSIWRAFATIILPIALPGMVAAFILSLVLTWNEYFFAALLPPRTPTRCLSWSQAKPALRGSAGGRWRRFRLRPSYR